MVKVENVSMKFNLGIEKNFSIKQFMVDTLSPSRRREKKSRKELNEFWALRDVSFDVERGEVVGLIGSNGAGKSTLLKIVAGVMKPTSGKVEVGGNICPMIELGAGFDFDLTAKENVFLNGAVMGYNKEFISSRYNEIVDFSELHDFMDVPVKNFSSGMVARLAFSIATVVDPEILIVDEILSVGDIAFQEKSKNKMMSMIQGGTTVLYVSHSIKSLMELCQKIVWLDHGRVKTIGGVEVCREYAEYVNVPLES